MLVSLFLTLVCAVATMMMTALAFRTCGTTLVHRVNNSSNRWMSMAGGATSPNDKATKQIADNKVMVFSKTYCPYCSKAKEALTNLGVKFTAYELDEQSDGAAIQAALLEITGQRTVPNIFVKGQHIGGCDNTLAAIESGKLQAMLK